MTSFVGFPSGSATISDICDGTHRAAKRSYPTSEVRGRIRKDPMPEGQQPRGVTPTSEVRGGSREELTMPEDRAAARQPPLPRPRSSGCPARAQEGRVELFRMKVRRGGGEEIPLIQGKEQRLHYAGAAVKRYPTFKVRETQVRW